MSGFGEQRHHGTYDDVAAELSAAARKLAAPLALAARNAAVKAQSETGRNKRQLVERQRFARISETQLRERDFRNSVDSSRQATTERRSTE